ncbi:MAG: MlaD family protein [Prevotellaceae bacterium]|jgi:phospholipid/cholesterol/gamma-HCH transport system substrate-binding protein|nr:MlaD family protein [Prevotellaceae bacterium]
MKISKEVKIGLYFIVTLVALIWGINYLRGLDIFNKVNKFYATYENVEGLQKTSPVFIKGMKVGTVSKIILERNEKFVVELKIKSDYEIPDNSTAYIYSSDIMGSKAIKIKTGDSQSFLADGDKITSGREVDMFSLFMDDLPSIKDSLKLTIGAVELTFNKINSILSDENIKHISEGLSSLEKTLGNFARLSQTLDRSKSTLVSALENIYVLTSNLKDNGDEITTIIKNFAELSDSLKNIRLSQTTDKLNALIDKINSGTGTVGKLLYSDSVHNTLAGSLHSLDSLLTDIRKRPKRYVNISVFGRKSN